MENGSGGSGMNNPFAMMGGMPGLAGLVGMGGGGLQGLNSGQISSMWGGMGGGRPLMPRPAMGMEQVKKNSSVKVLIVMLPNVTKK